MTAISLDLPDLLFLALALAAVGCLSGFLAGLLGIGGGIVVVPALYFVLDHFGIAPELQPHIAVGTSLATIIPTSILSMRTHAAKGSVDWDLAKRWAIWIALGVLAGLAIAASVKGAVLTAIFGVVAAVVAVQLALTPEGAHLTATLPGAPLLQLFGAGIGGFSTLMGIGGGTLSVPVLSLCNYPTRRAIGTASVLGCIIAVPGTLGFIWDGFGRAGLPPWSLGYVWLIGFACIAASSVFFAPIGARTAHTVNVFWLRKLFALFLALTSLKMLFAVL
jgi:uncharacterized protein